MIIDLHCDTLMGLYWAEKSGKNTGLYDYTGDLNLKKMMQGDALTQCFAMFVPELEEMKKKVGSLDDYHNAMLEIYQREIKKNEQYIQMAFSTADILKNKIEAKMSAVLTMEDMASCGTNLGRIQEYYAEGVRIMGIVWNNENSLAFPNSKNKETMQKGLKPLGIEAISEMNRLGIAVDVSHLNDGGFEDVARYSCKPFIATHSNARAVTGHPRNLTDKELRILAEAGGVVGLNFGHEFLHDNKKDEVSSYEDLLRHARHIANVAGADVLAIGSDYDGITSKPEWRDWSGAPQLEEKLATVFSQEEVDKICYKNALRTLKDIWGK